MLSKKQYLFFLAVLIFASADMHAKIVRRRRKPCITEENCRFNKKCQCYCSEKGDFRDKTIDDKPIYIKDDSNGKYCYCKQWDLDNYPGPTPRTTKKKSCGYQRRYE